MNYNKAQKIVFDCICRGNRCGKFMYDENNVFVSPDGYRGFIFPTASIAFNIEKVFDFGKLDILETVKEENKLELTMDMRVLPDKRLCRRLKGNGKNVFVNIKFLECFQNPCFYQAADVNSMIVVTEKMSAKSADIPVGIVLPIRMTEVGANYYGE